MENTCGSYWLLKGKILSKVIENCYKYEVNNDSYMRKGAKTLHNGEQTNKENISF